MHSTGRRPRRTAWTLPFAALACWATLSAATAAQAAFPGANTGKIAFESNRTGNSEIFTMNANGSGAANITNNPGFDEEANVSPDGRRVLFDSTRNGNADIFVVRSDGVGVSTPLTSSLGSDVRAAWSGDGSKVVFVSNRTGNDEIFVMNADGTNQVNISNNLARDDAPNWSADGKLITFHSRRTGNGDIYSMKPDGSAVKRLTESSANDADPKWAPNNLLITFSSARDGNYNIYVMTATGAVEKRLTTSTAEDGEPAFSPQGDAIVFLSRRDANYEIYRMRALDGASQVNLTKHAAQDGDPDWGPPAAAAPPPPPSGTFSCRASAVRLVNAEQEPIVANAAEQPCADAQDGQTSFEYGQLHPVIETDPFTMALPAAQTDLTAASSAVSTASAASTVIPPTEVSQRITVESLSAEARATCGEGTTPALTGSSQVTGLRIGSEDPITTSAPMDIVVVPLGTLHLNQQVVTATRIVQRAMYLEADDTFGLFGDIFAGEAIANFEGTPCP